MTTENNDQLRAFACELAAVGAKTARQYFGRVTAEAKPDDTPVTEADHAAQAAILETLVRRFPKHAIVVEEDVAQPDLHAAIESANYCWVVDPIDGTRNFVRGVPIYSTAVCVLHHGRPVAGAIHDALYDRVYSAAAGFGAFVGDKRLRIRNRGFASDTTVAVSSHRLHAIPPAAREWQECIALRNYGSLCMHLAWVAAGQLDATLAVECKLWDIAAGSLIIEESGGVATCPKGSPLWPLNLAEYENTDIPVLAGTPDMHAKLLASLRSDER